MKAIRSADMVLRSQRAHNAL